MSADEEPRVRARLEGDLELPLQKILDLIM